MRALVSFEAEAPEVVTEEEFRHWLEYELGARGSISIAICAKLEGSGHGELGDVITAKPFIRMGAQAYPTLPGRDERPPRTTPEDPWPERLLLAERLLEASRPFLAHYARGAARGEATATSNRAHACMREVDLFLHKLEAEREVRTKPRHVFHLGRLALALIDQPRGAAPVARATSTFSPKEGTRKTFKGLAVLLRPGTGETLFVGWRTAAAAAPAPAAGGEVA